MNLVFFLVTTVQILSKIGVLSRPQSPPTANATQQVANAFQDALNNGVDLPTNLQNSLQNIQNTTGNGVDLPGLAQTLGDTANQAGQNIPSLPNQPSNFPANLPQNLPVSIAQNAPANLAQVLPQQASNLTSVLPNIASDLQRNLGNARERLNQNIPQISSQSPLLGSQQNLSSLLPNLQRGLSQAPSINPQSPIQAGQVPQFIQTPSLNQGISSFLPRPTQNGQQPQLSQTPLLNQGSTLQQNPVQSPGQLPQFSSSFPNLTSAFGQNTLPSLSQNGPSSLGLNSSLMNFDLEEEDGSQISEQRRGQVSNSGGGRTKVWPLTGANPLQFQTGGLLGNLQQLTENQFQTTRDALMGTKKNLLESLKLRHAQRRLLRDQQRLSGLLGGENGGIISGGLGSGLGLLSGNPLGAQSSQNVENQPTNQVPTGSLVGGRLLGQNPGGLLGIIGRK